MKREYKITITDDDWEPEDGDALDAITDALSFACIPAFIESMNGALKNQKRTEKPIPGLWKYLDTSTVHIKKDDALKMTLLKDIGDVIAYRYEEGFFIPIPPKDSFMEKGYFGKLSPAIKAIFKKASELGCYIVRLDRDGELHSDLKTFNW